MVVFARGYFVPVCEGAAKVREACGEAACGFTCHCCYAAGTETCGDRCEKIFLPVEPADDQVPGLRFDGELVVFEIGAVAGRAWDYFYGLVDGCLRTDSLMAAALKTQLPEGSYALAVVLAGKLMSMLSRRRRP